MADERLDDKPTTKDEVRDNSGEFEDVDIASPGSSGGSGGLGYPTHPQDGNAADPLEETLSNGTTGVDTSGVQTGAGNTRMTITPSLSDPKKEKAEEKRRAKGSGS